MAPLFHETKESATPSKVKSHSKRNSGDLPSKTFSVVRTEESEVVSGPRFGEGRVHVMVESTAESDQLIQQTVGPGYLFEHCNIIMLQSNTNNHLPIGMSSK